MVALLTITHLLMTSVRRRQRDFAVLRALGFTSWQVRGTLCWQAVVLAAVALLVGVPAGIACGRLCWQVFAYQLGITPVVAVPLAALPIMAASWLAAAAVIAALSGKTATRNPRPECCTASSPPASNDLVSHRSHCPLSRHSLMPAIPLPYSSAGGAHRLRTCSQSASSGDSVGAIYRAPGKACAGGVKLPRATSRPMFAR